MCFRGRLQIVVYNEYLKVLTKNYPDCMATNYCIRGVGGSPPQRHMYSVKVDHFFLVRFCFVRKWGNGEGGMGKGDGCYSSEVEFHSFDIRHE